MSMNKKLVHVHRERKTAVDNVTTFCGITGRAPDLEYKIEAICGCDFCIKTYSDDYLQDIITCQDCKSLLLMRIA